MAVPQALLRHHILFLHANDWDKVINYSTWMVEIGDILRERYMGIIMMPLQLIILYCVLNIGFMIFVTPYLVLMFFIVFSLLVSLTAVVLYLSLLINIIIYCIIIPITIMASDKTHGYCYHSSWHYYYDTLISLSLIPSL